MIRRLCRAPLQTPRFVTHTNLGGLVWDGVGARGRRWTAWDSPSPPPSPAGEREFNESSPARVLRPKAPSRRIGQTDRRHCQYTPLATAGSRELDRRQRLLAAKATG